MRILLTALATLALSQAACAAGTLGMGFDEPNQPTSAPGAQATVQGTFTTKGSDNGKYTFVTTPGTGLESCVVSAGGGPAGSTVQVDTSAGDAVIDLTVTMMVSQTATFEVDCKVKATNDDDPSSATGADAAVLLTQ
jgi:hypothetical protein